MHFDYNAEEEEVTLVVVGTPCSALLREPGPASALLRRPDIELPNGKLSHGTTARDLSQVPHILIHLGVSRSQFDILLAFAFSFLVESIKMAPARKAWHFVGNRRVSNGSMGTTGCKMGKAQIIYVNLSHCAQACVLCVRLEPPDKNAKAVRKYPPLRGPESCFSRQYSQNRLL